MSTKQTKDIELDGRTYVLHKFPSVEGREIIAGYPLTALPKISEYSANQDVMYKNLSYVGVRLEGDKVQMLSTKALINNHTESWETVMLLEKAMLTYNCSFFQDGRLLNFLKDSAPNFLPLISKILTPGLVPSSQTEKQPSTN